MTNPNNAAQAAEQEAVRRALELYAESYDTMIRIAQRERREPVVSPVSVAFDIRKNMVNAVVAALSKLRAAGLPAGWQLVPAEPTEEMRQAGAQYAECGISANAVFGYRAMLNAAPVASAPADERAAFEYHARACELTRDEDAPEDYRNPHVQEYWSGWKARAALASAPVAGEAVALIADMRKFLIEAGHVGAMSLIHRANAALAAPQASAEYERGHDDGWAAGWDQALKQPQASEAVRNADVSALLSFIFDRFGQPGDAGELPDTVAAAVRRLERAVQPLAGTAAPVCSCPTGDGSLRWPCAVHPPPHRDAQPNTDGGAHG